LHLQCGDTFLLPKSAKATEHLWIIVTEVDEASGTAVCVNVTTKRDGSELTVVLDVGDHEYIKHKSVIHFADAREIQIELVEKLLAGRSAGFVSERHAPCSEALLTRIRQGLLTSRMTPREIKEKCAALWNC
jgi:hypothetical protein